MQKLYERMSLSNKIKNQEIDDHGETKYFW